MKHFDIILLRKKITETDLYIQELVLRKDLAGKDGLVLYSQACLGLLWKYVFLKDRLELRDNVLPVLKTAYTSMADKLVLSDKGKAFSTVFSELLDTLRFSSSDAEAHKTAYTHAADIIRFLETIGETAAAKYTSLQGKAILSGFLKSSLWRITKYSSMKLLAYLSAGMAASLSAYLEIHSTAEMASSFPVARSAHYRSLGESFPLTLESMQNMALEDLILEILE